MKKMFGRNQQNMTRDLKAKQEKKEHKSFTRILRNLKHVITLNLQMSLHQLHMKWRGYHLKNKSFFLFQTKVKLQTSRDLC